MVRIIGRRRKKKLKILLFVVIVLGVASAGLFTYIGTPNGCITCHEMKPFYDTWKASAHEELDCHECHSADISSYVNELIGHLQGVTASEIEIETQESLSNQQCLSCHKSLSNQPEKSSDISCLSCHEVNHYGHIVKVPGDYDCLICHGDHTMAVKEETCTSCHG